MATYLQLPVLRITKYHLLLQRYLKLLENNTFSHNQVLEALNLMKLVNDKINSDMPEFFDNQLIKGTINKTNTEECKYNNNSLFKKNKNHDLESDTLSFSLKKFVSKTGRNKKLDF